jgi:hypothetical protein
MAVPRDTSQEAFARQMAAFRAMTPQERVRLAAEMSDELREIVRAGIRARHPAADRAEVQAMLEDILLGPEIAAAARRAR